MARKTSGTAARSTPLWWTNYKDAGLAGVTVLPGIEGYGTHRRVHTERIEVLFQGLPVVIQAVDTPDKVAAALPLLDEMLTEALVTVQDVQAIRYTKSHP